MKMRMASCILMCVLGLSAARPACADFREERLSRSYQAAMADYSAGRLDAAMAGFAKVLSADGDNSSARFQLACLQHDFKHDYMAAICNYTEYLRLEGESDKASLAKERIALCEAELARVLANKYDLAGGETLLEESRKAREELASARKEIARGMKDYEEAQKKISVLQKENDRLRRMVASIGEDGSEDEGSSLLTGRLDEAKRLADGDEEDDGATAPDPSVKTGIASAATLAEDEDEKTFAGLADAKAILAETEEIEDDTRSDLIPSDAPPAQTGSRLSDFANKPQAAAGETQRPATYKVEDGDTLYKIALRFYGKTSAWKQIRDANKAVISTDGRVNSGQVIVLP